MTRSKTLAFAAAAAFAVAAIALPAHTQISRASVEVCRNEQDDARRLQCFDSFVQAENGTERGPIPAWLYDWQTLLTGIGAILAAIFTIRAIQHQIVLADSQEKDRIRRRRDAVRATLPLTLMAVLEYAKASVRELARIRPGPAGVANEDVHPPFSPPPLPIEMIAGLQSMIEAAPEIVIRDTLADIVEKLQIVAARMNGIRMHPETVSPGVTSIYVMTRHSFDELVLAFAELHTFATSLYEYGRRTATKPVYPAPGVDLRSSLLQLGVYKELPANAAMYEMADLRANSERFRRLADRAGAPRA